MNAAASAFDKPKERPIIFTAFSVTAILEGRKVMTRRLVKPQPERVPDEDLHGRAPGAVWWPSNKARTMVEPRDMGSLGPYGHKAERLWVKEVWGHIDDHVGPHTPACCWFRASRCVRCPSDAPRCEHGPDRWRSPLYMPRWASRILLALTSVRVERLQSITAADAAAEGMTCPSCGHPEVDKTCGYCDDFRDKHGRPPLVEAYAKTWDAIHARGDPAHAWSASPWVWVLSFRRLT